MYFFLLILFEIFFWNFFARFFAFSNSWIFFSKQLLYSSSCFNYEKGLLHCVDLWLVDVFIIIDKKRLILKVFLTQSQNLVMILNYSILNIVLYMCGFISYDNGNNIDVGYTGDCWLLDDDVNIIWNLSSCSKSVL